MNSFYSEEELAEIGLKSYGSNVLLSKKASIYGASDICIGSNVRIDDFCILSGRIVLGNYIHIAAYSALYAGNKGIFMEDYSTLSSKVVVYAVSDDYSGRSMTNPMIPEKYKQGMIEEAVFIRKHTIIGSGSVVLPGITIEEGSSIGALSLCRKDTVAWSINVGIPAEKIKERNRDLLVLEENFRKGEGKRVK